MIVLHVFKFDRNGKTVESPALGTGDIERLKQLFPDNIIWKAQTTSVGNVYLPSEPEARALYDALVKYYCANDVSDRQYPTGNFGGTFLVGSNLLSVFDDLIAFFEKELGFRKSEEAEKTISEKQKKHREAEKTKAATFREDVLRSFATIAPLRKPDDPILLKRLEKKLREYNTRKFDTFQHPELAMAVDSQYRDTTYKIEMLSAVLALENEEQLTLSGLAEKAFDEYGDELDPREYFAAYVVIAHYLGISVPGCSISKELPQATEAVA